MHVQEVVFVQTIGFGFCRGKQGNNTWPCQRLENSMKVLWSSLISPCWCLAVIAALFLFLCSDFALHSSCRFAGFSKYGQRNNYIFSVRAYEASAETASFDEL